MAGYTGPAVAARPGYVLGEIITRLRTRPGNGGSRDIVLAEARRPDDLAAFLNGGMLTTVWPEIFLPRPVQQAWEGQHPVLRHATPGWLPGRPAGRRAVPAPAAAQTGRVPA